MARHLVFIALIGVFVAVVHLAGVSLFPRRPPLLPFIGGAWVACYWEGPHIRSSLPSTSFRAEAILVGAAVMLLAVVFQFKRLLV